MVIYNITSKINLVVWCSLAVRHRSAALAFATSPSSTSKLQSIAFKTSKSHISRSFTNMMASTSSESDGKILKENDNNLIRGLFGGSGVEGMSHPLMNQQILSLLPPNKQSNLKDVKVLYLGTATYDIGIFYDKQTARFRDNGCHVSSLDVARCNINDDDAKKAIDDADILLVSGGNTLFAVDRWKHVGLVPHLKAAMERGCILTGGSAGAICWFDSGHSDSSDPETYLKPMVAEFENEFLNDKSKDESSDYDPLNKKEWKYLRVGGLGFVPGSFVCCPHHDKVQSNGLLRAHDFDEMLLARAKSSYKSVLGLGIDHYSAFIVQGDNYKIYVLPDKPGSVSVTNDGTSIFDVDDDGTVKGTPGVWLKRVLVSNNDKLEKKELVVEAMVCPAKGKLKDLLEFGGDNLIDQAVVDMDDNQVAVETCRKENPSGML